MGQKNMICGLQKQHPLLETDTSEAQNMQMTVWAAHFSSSFSFFGARYCLWFREIKLRAGRMGSPLCDKAGEMSFRKVTVDR